ncbi:MAG: thioredoxin domain-containing protein [Burkholderiales bacterium]
MNTTRIPNRLINETSPYLLQHAHNPVDWYPWGEEAFEKAKTEDKPVFLSIGYSTCHWCHVMAHESFEDEDVAKMLNASFVPIKVDREERPDVDEVYMSACQAMTGSGGWPLTVIMTPGKKPFFAGTYFPKETTYGRMGLIELLSKVSELWRDKRDELEQSGEEITGILSERAQRSGKGADLHEIIEEAYAHMRESFDDMYGGFSHSPKFPTPHYLLFLLNFWKAYDKPEALAMAEKTLESICRGGIFDHVGGGFSRYSTDRKWLVPHFEKMLYDNALLMLCLTECFVATGRQFCRDAAEKTAEYLARDMLSPAAFYSAQDADSEGVEGKYYVWTYGELKSLLREDELSLLESRYGVTRRGNFEGANILNLIDSKSERTEAEDAVLQKLYNERVKRVPPLTDTKISASWNGLAIEAFARAGSVFGSSEYVDYARRAANFILANMKGEDGLNATYKDGVRSKQGFLADYANFGGALVSLYEAALDLRYIKEAVALAKDMLELFWDEEDGRFYMTKKGGEELFMRPREDYDGAMPSGNSAAAMLLFKLYNITGADWAKRALDAVIEGFAPTAFASPAAYAHFASVLIKSTTPHKQVVIAADSGDAEAAAAYRDITRRFLPFTTVIYYDRSAQMDEVFPGLSQYKTDAPFSGYVCENFACRKPVYSPSELLRELGL